MTEQQEQVQTTIPKKDDVSNVQPSDEKVVTESAVEPAVTEEPKDEVSQSDNVESKPESKADDKVEPEADKQATDNSESAEPTSETNGSTQAESTDNEAKELNGQEATDKEVANGNGNGHANGNGLNESQDKVTEAASDDLNGVCKRKADNETEVEDEKTPKKAKTLEQDGDQAPVEETAA